jgi:hypothetical protein
MAVLTMEGARSRAAQFLLQIGLNEAPTMRREWSRVSFLMCPFCVRAPLLALTTPPGTGPLRRRSWQTRRRSPSRAAGCPSSMSRARPVAILATWGPLSYVSFYARRGSGARDAK